MEVVETLEEVYLRVSLLNLRPAWLEIVLALSTVITETAGRPGERPIRMGWASQPAVGA
ncbi:MAG: hypothetical protein ACRDLA_02550 [Thermoleophilaceae bacterium]